MRETLSLRVLVLHADDVVEAGVSAIVGRTTDMVAVVPSSEDLSDDDALHLCRSESVDVLVVDYQRALRFADLIAEAPPCFGRGHPKLLVLTDRDAHVDIRAALEAGVLGYLLCGCTAAVVRDAVRMVASGLRHLSSGATVRLLEGMLDRGLTARETEVLEQIATGCPNKVIAGRLGVEVTTIKVHVGAILEKLGARNRTEAVAIARRRGVFAGHGARRGGAEARLASLRLREQGDRHAVFERA